MAVDFKDEGSEKGFIELTLDNNYTVATIRKIPIRNQIYFQTIHLDDIDKNFVSNRKIVRIITPLEKSDSFLKVRQLMLKKGAIKFTIA